MTTEFTGKIKVIGNLQTFDSGFVKQQLVVTEEGQYGTDIPVDFLKDKTDLLQNYNVGDDVTVSINVKGSEYQGKYYLGATGWSIKKANSTSAPSQQANQSNSFVDNEQDDLPFK